MDVVEFSMAEVDAQKSREKKHQSTRELQARIVIVPDARDLRRL